MRLVFALLVLLPMAALPAYGGPPFACCYCTSPAMGNRALVCEAIPSGDINEVEARCEAKGADTISCVAALSPASCPGVFASANVICPEAAGAPVMSSSLAVLLAAALAGLGAIRLRARRRAAAVPA